MALSGLGTWWLVEADPGLGWLQCQCPLLFSKTGQAPTMPGQSSPMATVPAQPSTAMLQCSPFPFISPQCPGTAQSQRVQRLKFSRMINQVRQRQAGLQAGLQNHQQGCFCPFWSSLAPWLVQWLRVAWSHKSLCRDSRGREQPHDRLPSTAGTPGLIPGLYKLQGWRPRDTEQVTAPLVLPLPLQQCRSCCSAQSPDWAGVMLDLAVQYLGVSTPLKCRTGRR